MERKKDGARPEEGPIGEKYRKVVAALAANRIAMWEYDIPTGTCDFDDDYFRILGLEEAGIRYSDIDGFCRVALPEDGERYRREFDRLLRSEDKNWQLRARCIGRDGRLICLEDHFVCAMEDAEGNPLKLVAYTANITDRYEQETRIRRLEERSRKIIEALPEFIFIFDDDFFLHDVLMSRDTVLLHPVEELVGTDARTIYSAEVSDLFIRNIRQCLADGEIREIEYPLDKDGNRYYFQARIAPLEGRRVLALIHDIGERVRWSKELIEARASAVEADRMKSIFLATMSHEIRTPLNAIVGFSELIASGECGDEREEYLGIIRKSSDMLLQLVDDILDLTRIESGKSQFHFQQVGIAGLIEEVGKVHRLKTGPGVEFRLELPACECSLLTDRNRLMQVLFNFLSNAIKNTERGSITLGARLVDHWLEIYVEDTGCGIPEDKIPLIFNRFEKLNDFKQGTGLGLSICRTIAERLGGRIEVTSEVGRGSRFTLCLPHILPQKQEHASHHAAGPVHGETGRRKVILVAEDVETNFKLLNALLKQDYELRWVPDGEEAVHSFIRERPDLILMDLKMPVMNGLEATERIRAISADVPIIAVTAHAFYTEKHRALAAGCNAVVSKPYSPADLRRTIAQYI